MLLMMGMMGMLGMTCPHVRTAIDRSHARVHTHHNVCIQFTQDDPEPLNTRNTRATVASKRFKMTARAPEIMISQIRSPSGLSLNGC